ncbi:uncharacterized protein LOC121390442 [Gigantopelta aegis]|uniref:uncharacterized protein LOC121390442 n=1 Tax=Gigantopelta aegis TaxID=1735272 RepID=UPI001B8880FA|nr:uncharacterized protein LOC121390442 [Gigantopelta aegis]XP_041378194.1 uncharacterized protein LOC121390442 [Gigantopelta aegis]
MPKLSMDYLRGIHRKSVGWLESISGNIDWKKSKYRDPNNKHRLKLQELERDLNEIIPQCLKDDKVPPQFVDEVKAFHSYFYKGKSDELYEILMNEISCRKMYELFQKIVDLNKSLRVDFKEKISKRINAADPSLVKPIQQIISNNVCPNVSTENGIDTEKDITVVDKETFSHIQKGQSHHIYDQSITDQLGVQKSERNASKQINKLNIPHFLKFDNIPNSDLRGMAEFDVYTNSSKHLENLEKKTEDPGTRNSCEQIVHDNDGFSGTKKIRLIQNHDSDPSAVNTIKETSAGCRCPFDTSSHTPTQEDAQRNKQQIETIESNIRTHTAIPPTLSAYQRRRPQRQQVDVVVGTDLDRAYMTSDLRSSFSLKSSSPSTKTRVARPRPYTKPVCKRPDMLSSDRCHKTVDNNCYTISDPVLADHWVDSQARLPNDHHDVAVPTSVVMNDSCAVNMEGSETSPPQGNSYMGASSSERVDNVDVVDSFVFNRQSSTDSAISYIGTLPAEDTSEDDPNKILMDLRMNQLNCLMNIMKCHRSH